jgi:hypothetical protein
MSTRSPPESLGVTRPLSAYRVRTDTTRSAPGYGSGRRSTALTTLKIAVVAPTPSAIVSSATAVNDGAAASARTP